MKVFLLALLSLLLVNSLFGPAPTIKLTRASGSHAVQAGKKNSGQGTKVVLLGTGTPNADPDRAGPAVAVVVNDTPYLVDFGPGVVRRAAAAHRKGVAGLAVNKLKIALATHLHSDHTGGLSDLILTPAVLDRNAPLELYGPKGIKAMAAHILKAYEQDIEIRVEGLEHGNRAAYQVNAHEIKPGIIYRDQNVMVKAFLVDHGAWREAYGYRFETPDRTVVISGDCTKSPSIIENCNGCDVLVHEVYSEAGLAKRTPQWQKYHSTFHTSSRDLAEIATKARPKLLVLYHQLTWSASEADLIKEIAAHYQGKFVSGQDLDIY